MTKVSIIVPVFNSMAHLKCCLNSIFCQKFDDFEVICINDGSSDNSLEILKEYEKKYSNLKIISHILNQGQGSARNSGLKIAIGDFISFIDSDDSIPPNFLNTLYTKAISSNSEVVACNLDIKTNKKIKKYKIQNKKYTSYLDKIKAIKNGSPCNKLFKRELLVNNEIFFPQDVYFEDNLFLIKALYFSKTFTTTNKTSYFYHINPNSITRINKTKENPKKIFSTIFILNKVMDFASKNNLNKEEVRQTKLFCLRSFVDGELLEFENFKNNLPKSLKNDKEFINFFKNVQYQNTKERLFSIKNTKNRKLKVITIFGLPIKFKREKMQNEKNTIFYAR